GEDLVARADTNAAGLDHGVLSVTELSGVVLRDVTFQAHGGEVLGVAGLTGSGRDELLSLLFGARAPRRGTVTVGGDAIPAAQPSAAITAGMALVPADRNRAGSITTLSVRENLVLTDLRRHGTRLGALRREAERAEV